MVRMDTGYDFKLLTMEFELPAPGMRNPPDVMLHGVTCRKPVVPTTSNRVCVRMSVVKHANAFRKHYTVAITSEKNANAFRKY